MKGSDLLVAALENEGVDRIFGVPGEENLDVVESLAALVDRAGADPPRAGGGLHGGHLRAAHRQARASALTTLGPGALNLVTGAAYALLGAMPMVMITGQKAIHESRAGALPDRRHRRDDAAADQAVATDRQRREHSDRRARCLSHRARRSGPARCISNCRRTSPRSEAGDVAAGAAACRWNCRSPSRRRRSSARPNDPGRQVSAGDARRRGEPPAPGAGAVGVSSAVSASRSSTRRWARARSAGASDFYMGTAALDERDYVHEAIDRADLIIADRPRHGREAAVPHGPGRPQVIHVGYMPANVEEVYFPHAEVIGDIGPSLDLLADRLEGKLHHGPGAARLCARTSWPTSPTGPTRTAFRLTPQRIVHDVRQVMPADGIVALDNGMYKIWFARNYRTDVANTLLLDNALATMGAGLPSGDDGGAAVSGAARAGGVRRRRLHDELPGARNRACGSSSTSSC